MAQIIFFAQLREQIGAAHVEINFPSQVTTVGELLSFLRSLGEPYSAVINFPRLQIAVNQHYARAGDAISNQDEIAFFPPVSGG